MLKKARSNYRMAATMIAAAAPASLTAPVGRGAPPVNVLATGATGTELDGFKVVGAGGGVVTGAGGGGGGVVVTGAGGGGGGGGGALVTGTALLQSCHW